MTDEKYVNVQGRLLRLSHLSKIFYPSTGFTKQNILSYYQAIAPTVLPHIAERPFTMRRFPNGVTGSAFYEKQCPHYRQKWVSTGIFGSTNYCLVNDLPTLLWVVNLAAIELHTTLGKIQAIELPTICVFDLDPGEGVDIRACIEVARLLQQLLKALGLAAFPKTSGMKGLHVILPLNSKQGFPIVREFARGCAEFLEQRFPDQVTAKMPKRYRPGKVYVDWQQNADFKTTTAVYSLRANETPTVSTPLAWNELKTRRILSFETEEVLARVHKMGDLAAPALSLVQKVPSFNKALEQHLDWEFRSKRGKVA